VAAVIPGYHGNLLEVDLSTGKISARELDSETLQRTVGGTGLGARILWDELAPGTVPLSENALLLLLAGPLAATRVPCADRTSVVCKSPLTGIWAEADVGGNLMVDDIEAAALANDLCNGYGMDTISVGQVIGLACESFELGYLEERDLEGLHAQWGDPESLIALVRWIAEKRGIGGQLPRMSKEYYRIRNLGDGLSGGCCYGANKA
jgi:aldehyde:ferredoxin oxidoreductase